MESNIELEISQLNAELLRLKSEIVSFENTRKSEVQMLKERVLRRRRLVPLQLPRFAVRASRPMLWQSSRLQEQ